MTLNIAIVGAGGMGMRHALGYAELRRYFEDVCVVAVVDRHVDSAQAVAQAIASRTSDAPKVLASLDELAADRSLSVDAVDIVTNTLAHHTLAIDAMNSGYDVMVEKPMGLTLTACRRMQAVEAATGRTLAVSENFRRDPMNRLTKALLEAGAIGEPRFALDFSLGSAQRGVMHSTVWRAKKLHAGGVVLDAGVHNSDLLLYLMGTADHVYAETDVNDPNRTLRPMAEQAPGLASAYQHRHEEGGETVGDGVDQDAVDTAFASVRFDSGAVGQMIITDAAHGYALHESVVVGSEGTLYRPPSRRGTGPRIVRMDGSEVEGDDLLDTVPDFELDATTAALWDDAYRLHSYEMDFRQIDAKIIAIEYMDFARAVAENGRPEVGSDEGMAALALTYGILESGEIGQPVAIDDVVSGKVNRLQSEIDAAAGID